LACKERPPRTLSKQRVYRRRTHIAIPARCSNTNITRTSHAMSIWFTRLSKRRLASTRGLRLGLLRVLVRCGRHIRLQRLLSLDYWPFLAYSAPSSPYSWYGFLKHSFS